MFDISVETRILFSESVLNNLPLTADIRGRVHIAGYMAGRFPSEEMAKRDLAGRLPQIVSRCMTVWPAGQAVVCNERNGILAGLVADALRMEGVNANVQITDFVLTDESIKNYNRAVSDQQELAKANVGMPIMMMMGGSYDGMQGTEGMTGMNGMTGMPMMMGVMGAMSAMGAMGAGGAGGMNPTGAGGAGQAGFCTNCGAARQANAKFCSECGQSF